MGSEEEEKGRSRRRVTMRGMQCVSPERSGTGTVTPPLQTSAAVPFRWEQEPGKPIPSTCTALVPFSSIPKCLDLPPRLLLPSPNTFRSPSFAAHTTKGEGWCWWRKNPFKLNTDITRGTHVYPSTTHTINTIPTFSRNPRAWTTICDGLKQAVPWRNKKMKKDGSAL